jgi:hypothetical protein
MEAVLLIVTLLSLTIAICTSVLAWRVMRNERRRSEARIAALTADLAVVEEHRTIREDRPQAPAARADLPMADLQVRTTEDLNVRTTEADWEAVAGSPIPDDAVAAPRGMFAPSERGRSWFRVAAGVSAAALIGAVVIGSLVMTSEGTPSISSGRANEPVVAAPATAAAASMPLELIALGHEREADRLTVRGIVRGSVPGAEKGQLTAVVLLFSREGTFIASGRAEVQPAPADPAAERTFIVTVPSAGDVGRYRVSFRSDEQIVPHVDKRVQAGQLKSAAEPGKSQI